MKRSFALTKPLDLGLTLRPLQHGRGDPVTRIERGQVWRATRTPEGPGTQHLRVQSDRVEVEAWGPGAAWLLEHSPELVGENDDDRTFVPEDAALHDLHKRYAGLRICHSRAVIEAIVPTILEQKVTGAGARRSYRALMRASGEPAPGPFDLLLPPTPKILASIPYEDMHPLGVERKRAMTVKVACSYARRLEETCTMEADAAWKRLLALPGVGPWTTALVARVAWGDPDAVEVGDFHVPHLVSWFFAGEPRGSDERMLELLDRYRGHRGRVIRLIEASGVRAPRYGPRMEIVSYARM